jgi:hypothetical protein
MFFLNYPAILVAALAAFFIGFLWHGPVLGKQWIKLMKLTPADIEKGRKEMAKNMPIVMLLSLVQQLVTATVISMLSNAIGVADAFDAVVLAILLWLGLIATTLLNAVLWEKRSMSLYLFNIAYHLVSLVVIALIVGLWR